MWEVRAYPSLKRLVSTYPRACALIHSLLTDISYGVAEYDLPRRYQLRQCSEIMKLSLQGS